ncbi:P-loop containing nucleoside triphosphate hydrolase protein [Rickenella mellea]|uniref:P-loop containing nucleoside triphosphate hydrolase protein n=1 Tax=Rickenella mellea TaxID=50990 RepID=A0A4Y7PT02_9AGAM|nr:P-loop containing nucleoside triphosphate hydrolase protein [Rickenella mellea]
MPREHKPLLADNTITSEASEKPPAIIAIMGSTGVGKTSFINKVTGQNLPVGHELDSCTSEIKEVRLKRGKRNVVLMDTPGFGGSSMSDTEVLRLITKHLMTSYKAGARLTGVIYMHSISPATVDDVTRRNFKMFHKFCGSEHLQQVAIVTTGWDKVDRITGESRESQLRTGQTLFKPMLDHNATMMRHDGTIASAKDIVDHFLRLERIELRIQRQMIVDKLTLPVTDAGSVISDPINDVRRCVERLAAIRDELRAAKEVYSRTRNLLEEERMELREEKRALRGQMKTLTKSLDERFLLWRFLWF